MVQKYLPSFAQQEATQSGEVPQGAGIHSKPVDAEHLTKVYEK